MKKSARGKRENADIAAILRAEKAWVRRLKLTPKQAELFVSSGLHAKLSGDPPLDVTRSMLLTVDDCGTILATLPMRGRTAMSLRRAAKWRMDSASGGAR